MFRTRRILLCVVGVCVLALGSMPGAAGAAKTVKQSGTFELTLTGTQRLQWSRNYEDDGFDDENGNPVVKRCTGSGSEVVNFVTPSPLTVKVEMIGSGRDHRARFKFSGGSFKEPSFKVQAKVQRTANFSAEQDCGLLVPNQGGTTWHSCTATATVDWGLTILSVKRDLYWFQYLVDNRARNKGVDAPLAGCRNRGLERFPSLYARDDMTASGIPANPNKLFDSGKDTVRAKASFPWREKGDEPGESREAFDVKWTLKLKRKR